jgi:hypothetical protein
LYVKIFLSQHIWVGFDSDRAERVASINAWTYSGDKGDRHGFPIEMAHERAD